MRSQQPDPAIGAIIDQSIAGLLIGEIEYHNQLSAVVRAVPVYGQYGAACQVGPYIFAGEVFEKGMGLSEGDQLPVPVQQQAIGFMASLIPLQFGLEEKVLVLRVRRLAAPFKGGEFFFPSFSQCVSHMLVLVVGEKIKGNVLAVFFSHEQQGKIWG